MSPAGLFGSLLNIIDLTSVPIVSSPEHARVVKTGRMQFLPYPNPSLFTREIIDTAA
jgi:hypothetical protein